MLSVFSFSRNYDGGKLDKNYLVFYQIPTISSSMQMKIVIATEVIKVLQNVMLELLIFITNCLLMVPIAYLCHQTNMLNFESGYPNLLIVDI